MDSNKYGKHKNKAAQFCKSATWTIKGEMSEQNQEAIVYCIRALAGNEVATMWWGERPLWRRVFTDWQRN